MPKEIPDEFSAPDGNPIEKYVSQRIYQELLKAREEGKYGLRFYTRFSEE